MTEIGVLVRLIEQLQRLPGIGAKGAQRLAFHLLRKPREDVDQLLDARRRTARRTLAARRSSRV